MPMDVSSLWQKRAFLFDFDGTLLDSLPGIIDVVRATESELGLPHTSDEKIGLWVGNGAQMLARRILSGRFEGDADPAQVDRVMPVIMRHYNELGVHNADFYPAGLELLKALRGRGIKTALVTNKPAEVTHRVLEHLAASDAFDAVVGGGDTPRIKPDPDMLWLAAERLNTAVEDCVMVGDSSNDTQAAKAAGMTCVGLRNGYNHGRPIEDSDPDWVFDTLKDLLDSLENA
ncbi:phosphoglycolate phosphatase, bacterial [gamma proteobacterium HTCC5015]|nr:phosphoglycolate phosphatase, bacterial [gamma proteobacterium HTCC5015]